MDQPRKRTFSPVMDHFDLLTDNKVKCRICSQRLSYINRSTSTLLRHYRARHEKEEPVNAPLINYGASRKQVVDDASLNMIIKDCQPLSIVEEEVIREPLQVLEPSYVLPSRTAIKNMISQQYGKELKTSMNMEACMAGTCHYIDRENHTVYAGYEFDICYTSVLKRAIRTLWFVLDSIDQMWLPVHRTWRLNERHYGGLTGLNKAETAAIHGEAQVKIWRRSFDIPPPPMDEGHDFYQAISKDRRYADLTAEQLPTCESLKDTIARALPFWNDEIAPKIKEGKRVLIAAHGNSLRGIVKHLEGMSEEAIMELNLPTGIPIVYELDKNLKPVGNMQFLGDEETVQKAMAAVAAQGKVKK